MPTWGWQGPRDAASLASFLTARLTSVLEVYVATWLAFSRASSVVITYTASSASAPSVVLGPVVRTVFIADATCTVAARVLAVTCAGPLLCSGILSFVDLSAQRGWRQLG